MEINFYMEIEERLTHRNQIILTMWVKLLSVSKECGHFISEKNTAHHFFFQKESITDDAVLSTPPWLKAIQTNEYPQMPRGPRHKEGRKQKREKNKKTRLDRSEWKYSFNPRTCACYIAVLLIMSVYYRLYPGLTQSVRGLRLPNTAKLAARPAVATPFTASPPKRRRAPPKVQKEESRSIVPPTKAFNRSCSWFSLSSSTNLKNSDLPSSVSLEVLDAKNMDVLGCCNACILVGPICKAFSFNSKLRQCWLKKTGSNILLEHKEHTVTGIYQRVNILSGASARPRNSAAPSDTTDGHFAALPEGLALAIDRNGESKLTSLFVQDKLIYVFAGRPQLVSKFSSELPESLSTILKDIIQTASDKFPLVVDVGVGDGVYSLFAAMIGATVYAIVPRSSAFLQHSARLNGVAENLKIFSYKESLLSGILAFPLKINVLLFNLKGFELDAMSSARLLFTHRQVHHVLTNVSPLSVWRESHKVQKMKNFKEFALLFFRAMDEVFNFEILLVRSPIFDSYPAPFEVGKGGLKLLNNHQLRLEWIRIMKACDCESTLWFRLNPLKGTVSPLST